MTFDGSFVFAIGEGIVIVGRIVTDELEIAQEELDMKVLGKSVTGEELARHIFDSVCTEMGLSLRFFFQPCMIGHL